MTHNTNIQPATDKGPTPGSPSPRRSGLLLLAGVVGLLLLGGSVGGTLWWRARHTGTNTGPSPTGENPNLISTTQRPACSDDDDPKYLEPLEFGPPIEVRFDRRSLDALKDRPIPAVEKYLWLPDGLVAILGEHRMRGPVLAVSPDGKLLAVVNNATPGFIRIGVVETLHEKTVVPCPGGARMLIWSPDGETLAVVCRDGVRLFDVRDLEKVPAPVTLEKAAAPITSLCYSADGKYLLGGDSTPQGGSAWVWETAARKLALKPLKHIGPVNSVAFSPVPGDYRALTAGGSEDGQIHLWEVPQGKEIKSIDFRLNKFDKDTTVGQVAFSPDGKRALSSHSDKSLRLWDLNRFEKDHELRVIKGRSGFPAAIFSPDGQMLAATHVVAGGGVWLLHAQDGKQVRRLGTSPNVHAFRFLAGGDRLVFSEGAGHLPNIHVHEVGTGMEVHPPIGHLASVAGVALSPAGQLAASSGFDSSLRLWDLDRAEQKHRIGAPPAGGLGFHPDGKQTFVWGASYNTTALHDVQSGKACAPQYDNQHSGGVVTADITRDGRYAVTGGFHDGTVRMWRLQDGKQVRHFVLGPGQSAATLCPDMRRVVAIQGGKAHLLHLRCQETRHEWPKAPAWAPFLPDGKCVFFGGATAPVWKVTTDTPEQTGQLPLHLPAQTGSLSGDGRRVAAVVAGRAEVFEVETGRSLWSWTPPKHFGTVNGLALSSDGGHLATANGDGTVYIVQLP